jgi:hypothetical protein
VGKDAGSPPPAPDYVGAAQATGQSNLDAVRAQTAANRINQYTPYGSLQYYQDPSSTDPDRGWSSVVTLSPEQQKLLDQQNQTSLGLSGLANSGLDYVKSTLGNQINLNSLPKSMVNPGETGYDALMRRYQPQIDQSRKALENQLANQGVMAGTEAYDNAMRSQYQSENDLRSQAALQGIGIGQDAQNQQLGLLMALQNNPINVLNAVRTGSQVTNPTFGAVPQQQNAGGVDYMGATKGMSDYNMGVYNSDVAAANAGNSAATGLAGAAITAAAFF